MTTTERRRYRRVKLRQPIRGVIGDTPVYVLDASPGGVQIAHKAALPSPGAFCRLDIRSDLGPLKLDCQVIRTVNGRALSQTGLAIVAADMQSTERLRSLFA